MILTLEIKKLYIISINFDISNIKFIDFNALLFSKIKRLNKLKLKRLKL